MSGKRKRANATLPVSRQPSARKHGVIVRAQREPALEVRPGHIPLPKIPPANATNDDIRAFLAPLPFARIIEALEERVIEANGREILEFLTLRGESSKPRIEKACGRSLSTEEAGMVLDRSSETVRSYVRNGRLVGYAAANDGTKIRLPEWQFHGSGAHAWVPELIQAFGENGWPLLDFLTVERGHLDKSYLDLLRTGELEDVMAVIAAARRSTPD